ncbi:MAG TPA: hypothetical protein PKB14_25485 [Rubrivivax sp.]|nr:hypothetical protein [Rubrivivax sp.]
MTDSTLQERFSQALRRELGNKADSAQPGAPVVNVQPPAVTVAPEVRLPELPQPLEVVDIERHSGAFLWRVEISRDHLGAIKSAEVRPVRFVLEQEMT